MPDATTTQAQDRIPISARRSTTRKENSPRFTTPTLSDHVVRDILLPEEEPLLALARSRHPLRHALWITLLATAYPFYAMAVFFCGTVAVMFVPWLLSLYFIRE